MTAKQAWRSAWRDVRNRCAGRNTSGRHGVQVARAALVAFDARQREEKAARAAQLLAVPLLPLVLKRRRGGGAPPAPAMAMAMALLVAGRLLQARTARKREHSAGRGSHT